MFTLRRSKVEPWEGERGGGDAVTYTGRLFICTVSVSGRGDLVMNYN